MSNVCNIDIRQYNITCKIYINLIGSSGSAKYPVYTAALASNCQGTTASFRHILMYLLNYVLKERIHCRYQSLLKHNRLRCRHGSCVLIEWRYCTKYSVQPVCSRGGLNFWKVCAFYQLRSQTRWRKFRADMKFSVSVKPP